MLPDEPVPQVVSSLQLSIAFDSHTFDDMHVYVRASGCTETHRQE